MSVENNVKIDSKAAKTPVEETYELLQNLYTCFNQKLFNGKLPECLITLQRQPNVMGYFARSRFYNKDNKEEKTHEIALNPEFFKKGFMEVAQTLCHECSHLFQQEYGTPSRNGYHNKEWAKIMISIGLMPSTTGEVGGAITGQNMSDYPISGGLFERTVLEFMKTNNELKWYDYWAALKEDRENKAESIRDYIIRNFGEGKIKQNVSVEDKDYVNPILQICLEKEQDFVGPDKETSSNLIPVHAEVESGDLKIIAEDLGGNRMKYTCDGCGTNIWGKMGLNLICADCSRVFKYNIQEKKSRRKRGMQDTANAY